MKHSWKTRIFSLAVVLIMLMSYVPVGTVAAGGFTDITAIERPTGIVIVEDYDDYVGDNWAETLGLPQTVEITLGDGSKQEVMVTWDTSVIDTRTTGYYSVPGQMLLPPGTGNSQNLKAAITIQVQEKKNLFANGGFESSNGTVPTGWYMPGLGTRITREFVRSGEAAGWARSANKIDSKRNGYNREGTDLPATVAARVNAVGAGQYYFGIYGRKGEHDAVVTFDALFTYRAGTQTSIPANQKIGGNKITLTTDYQASSGVIELPDDLNFVQMQFTFSKTDSSVTFDDIGAYVDDAELFVLKTALKVEPSAIAEIMTETPVRAVVLNYPDYVGENWKASLGLPNAVEVLTDNGNTASVDVEWNYDNLKLDKEGKYILVGTLDDSGFPNPEGLTATQIIFVRPYKNLITNPSFEGSFTGWYLRGANPNPSVTDAVFKQGKYAALTGAMSTTKTVDSIADTRKMVEALDAGVALQGGGQYYFGAWVQMASQTMIEGMRVQSRLNYKTRNEEGVLSSNNVGQGAWAELNNKSFSQTSGVLELPSNAEEVRMDLYISGQKAEDLCATRFYIDAAELIPLNVIVPQYEGTMAQVESIIPDRQIIKDYPDYIGEGYTTADLMLPETVKVRSTTNEIIDVEVKWDYSTLNLSKTGTYTVYGVLDEMKIANPKALTVKQTIKVVSKQNIFINSSFEDDLAGWDNSSMVTMQAGVVSPHRTGDFSLMMTVGRLDSYERNWIQAFFNGGVAEIGQKITRSGAGRYYYGGWVHGSKSSLDIEVHMRLHYRCLSTGDSVIAATSPNVKPSAKEFLQVGDIVELPDDVYSAHMDLYILGTAQQMRLSELYIDDFELIPLNVEIPNLTDIIDCADVADVYVHEDASVQDLKLPKALQVIIKNGQKFDLGVTWDTSSFDPNQLGEQTITGSLNLGKTYKNPKNFVPTVKITVRAKGEDLRQTIYISTSGSETNDGLSPETPKQDVKKIGTYLQQGYNVKLKRGDIWYIPTGGITLSQIRGTEDAPLTLGAYGSDDKLPVIGYLMKIEQAAWKLVDESRNIYAADVSALGQRDGITVHRCFVEDAPYKFKDRTNYASLKAGEYCSYGLNLYIRMPEGEKPGKVEVTPYGTGGTRLTINNVSHLSIEYIHFKGSSAYSRMMQIDAPTEYLKFRYCSITHCFYYIMMWDSADEQVHYKPEISNCYIDAVLNEEEGKENESPLKHWDVHSIEGITMRDGVDGAWIHNNHMRNMAHAFIAIESTERTGDYTTTGVRNCIIEDNLLEGVNAQYARAFNICGGYNLSGVQMCRDNTYRRNRCYDMTASSHLYGENNLIYSNLFSYVHSPYDEEGNILDGKGSQPWGFDSVPWSDHSSVGNMVINNTFYNVSSAVGIYDQAHTVYNNLYANNLIVNWTSDAGANNSASGAFFDHSIDLQYVMNNGVFSTKGSIDHFVVDLDIFRAEDVNDAVAGYSGNISADPLFADADLSQMVHGARIDFTLSNQSPMRYAGLSLHNSVYQIFPAWERMKADYTDINGVVYLAESPSIGAWSFCEKIKGDVAEVGKLEDILARPGATIDQLNLPDAVPAVNEKGIDVMLLADWSNATLDSSKPGTVTLTASLRNGPHTDLNINGKTASLNVNIKDKLELLNVTTVLKKVTVLYGTSFEDAVKQLPSTLDVMEESGYKEALPVSWACDNYDPTKPDAYTFKCVLPADMITNAREFPLEVEVRLLHEIGIGMELLVNPDFNEGGSGAPWKIGWGVGNFRITTDPELVYPGEPTAAIVTVNRKYASLQQDVVGQLQLMGDGQYLFKVYMRAFDRPIDTSYACLKVWGPNTYTVRCRSKSNIGSDWVEFSAILDVTDVAQATEITFHTSTGKSDEDVEEDPKSYVISGCSLVYLGKSDAEVEATMDSIDLNWNMIKGENGLDYQVTSDLSLPGKIGSGSTIKWTSSDESAITNDGKVTLGRVSKTVTLTATISYGKYEIIKKFTVTVPRNPDLPTFTGSLSGAETANVGDEINFTISLKGKNADSFNAYRFTMSFNAGKLEYVGIDDPTSTVEVDGGRITISGIGTERPLTDTITVTFKVKKSGITEVKLVQVEMDSDSDVTLDTLPTMEVKNGTVTIDVAKVDEPEADAGTDDSGKIDPVVIIIVMVVIVALLAVTGVIIIIVIKKKK